MTGDSIKQVSDTDETGGTKAVLGAQTLERGLDLLERVTHDPMPILELIRQSGMNRGVVYRLVAALTARNYLTLASDGRLRGGSKLLQLGHSTAAYTDIVTIAKPHLDALAIQTGLSAFLARREGNYSVHLLRAAGTERLAVTTQPGTRRLLPETGLGKTLMSDDAPAAAAKIVKLVDPRYRQAGLEDQLARVREAGVLLQIGSAPDHINSVCAPVRNATGQIIGAINVAAAAQYLDDATMLQIQPHVAEAARAISSELGAYPASPQ
ncbi:IclR family transcriptional regulator [Sphingomonas sp. PB2P19]|uniref:IclR family transcriptional regulator n=1 Tax=Sphingomonas rhamnosi TaxID=3096156 RepID=UPI002FC70593